MLQFETLIRNYFLVLYSITLSNLYTQIDGYVQSNVDNVQIYHVHKHPDTNLRFYLILYSLKLLTSRNSCLQLAFGYMFTVVKVFTFDNFRYNH